MSSRFNAQIRRLVCIVAPHRACLGGSRDWERDAGASFYSILFTHDPVSGGIVGVSACKEWERPLCGECSGCGRIATQRSLPFCIVEPCSAYHDGHFARQHGCRTPKRLRCVRILLTGLIGCGTWSCSDRRRPARCDPQSRRARPSRQFDPGRADTCRRGSRLRWPAP